MQEGGVMNAWTGLGTSPSRRRLGRNLAVVAALWAVAVGGARGVAQSDDDRLHAVLPPDAIPAIDDPVFDPPGRARMLGDELVIGLVGQGGARAYSTWELDEHEIVNDEFEGRPIAVTW